ncbi:phospho-sugar mutase [Iamia sp.]|uniref:phospho-sugar mutase n=1 Tax=Iamia sp. TaxID=2722710 RepID=UPI002D15CEA8|nr:phospho-sugar mutase [Iamia sp.]HXH55744.1 phospho-sugar mutase [Iamia sp.]
MTEPVEAEAEAVEALIARVRAWADDDPQPSTARHLRELTHLVEDGTPGEVARATAELRELFRDGLAFGTAGLRGEVGPGPNRMNVAVVRRAAAGVAAWVRASGSTEGGVIVGRDARHGSEAFVAETVEVLTGIGLDVHILGGPVPTPVLAFAVRRHRAAAGIMVTASHNPGRDNGYKVYDREGRQIDSDQAAEIATAMAGAGRVTDLPSGGAGNPKVHPVGLDLVDEYVSAIADDVLVRRHDRATVQVAHTSLHGVGGPVVRQACRHVGFVTLHEVPEQSEADPDFPTVAFPNPEEPGALDRLRTLAAYVSADVALANDPDADRLAMAVWDPALGDQREASSWRKLTGDELGWLLADHLIRRGGFPPHGILATTIVSSTLLRALAAEAGVGYAETLTGFKWIVRASTPEHPLILGYEEALGYCIGDQVRDKDGISALLVAAEMVSDLVEHGLTVLDRLDDLARRFGVHATGQWSLRLEGADGAARIAAAMARLRAAPPATIGHRVVAGVSDLADGAPGRGLPPADVVGLALHGARVVVRPSGTEPKLKGYVEVVEPVDEGGDLAAARVTAAAGLSALIAALPAALGLA